MLVVYSSKIYFAFFCSCLGFSRRFYFMVTFSFSCQLFNFQSSVFGLVHGIVCCALHCVFLCCCSNVVQFLGENAIPENCLFFTSLRCFAQLGFFVSFQNLTVQIRLKFYLLTAERHNASIFRVSGYSFFVNFFQLFQICNVIKLLC